MVYRPGMLHRVVGVAAIIAIALSLWQIASATTGLAIVRSHLGTIPVTVVRAETTKRAPVIVICHGFAGSQQMMLPFATTLARNGYVAVTFDFPGHARNSAPLPGGINDYEASGRALLESLDAVASFAQKLPESDGRLALLGHSMASDVVVRYAQQHPNVAATVALSLFSRDITATSPRNLLIIDGALEAAFLRDEGFRVVGLTAGAAAVERHTYGSFAEATARRIVLAEGVEHIGVLYSRDSMAETLAWLNDVTGGTGAGFLDRRGPWLGLLYLGIVMLAWPLSHLLPQVAAASARIPPRWPRLLGIAAIPAILTPLILWQLPTSFLPILLGDYLALHFGLYGLLTFLTIRFGTARAPAMAETVDYGKFAAAAFVASIFCVAAIAVPTDWFVTSYWPTSDRLPLVLGMLCGTFPYFAADEYLTRETARRRGVYVLTKVFFLASLLLAVGLNFQKLFFLLIIVPVMLVFFLIYGLFSTWLYRRTRHPMVGAVAVSIAIAWGISVTFPLVSR